MTPRYDSGRYEISDLEARAEDGVMVPDTLVRPKGTKGPQIVLIQAYGSYRISQLANFSLRTVSFLEFCTGVPRRRTTRPPGCYRV